MQIRNMTADDYDRAIALWRECGNMGLRALDDSKEGIARFLARNPATSFVAVEDGVLVGAILCGHDGRRGYIYHTAVRADFRRQGFARALVEAAVSALQGEGITRVCLNVMESNAAGIRFWQKLGWEKKDFLGFYSKPVCGAGNEPLSGKR